MAFIAPAIPYVMAAAATVSAYMVYQQSQASKDVGRYNAAINAQNADISRQQAAMQARQIERENFMRLGHIRAAQGKSGGTAEGSFLDVVGDVAAQGELERQNVLYRGELAARGYRNTAALDESQGTNAARAGVMRAGGELLSGISSAYTTGTALKRA